MEKRKIETKILPSLEYTEELTGSERLWDCIEVKLEYGYFGDNPPVKITCYSDGRLIFEAENGIVGMPFEKVVDDRRHEVSKKSLARLDDLVGEIAEIECLEGGSMDDGPSFECYVQLSNGTVTGFHYVSIWLSEEFRNLETRLRQLLREDFFLRKHKKELGF